MVSFSTTDFASIHQFLNFYDFFFSNSGMAALVDRIIQASIPSYDLTVGDGLIFNNGTNETEDNQQFMISRLKIAQRIADQKKIERVRYYLSTIS